MIRVCEEEDQTAHDARERDHGGEPLPGPGAAFVRASGPMMLCDEGLHAGRRADEETRECPDPHSAEADRAELRRSESAYDHGIDDAHRRHQDLRQHQGRRERGHFSHSAARIRIVLDVHRRPRET